MLYMIYDLQHMTSLIIFPQAIIEEKTSAEESLAQIKKNISSLEQLAEEHKKQTVNTRSDFHHILMVFMSAVVRCIVICKCNYLPLQLICCLVFLNILWPYIEDHS